MINEYICYKCKCDKCKAEWITRTHEIPVRCAKCNSVKWNEFSAPASQQISEDHAKRIVEVSQPIVDDRKTLLASLQAKIDGIEDEPKQIAIDDNWIEMPTTIENGETLYWHRKIKGAPVCYKRETNWDTFA